MLTLPISNSTHRYKVFFPPRFKGAGQSTPTHPVCLSSTQKVNWDTSAYPEYNPQLQHLAGSDMLVILTKDPSAPIILYDPALTTNRLVVYNWVYSGSNTASIYNFPIARSDSACLRTSGMMFDSIQGDRSPHGQYTIARGNPKAPDTMRGNYLDGLPTTNSLDTSSISVTLLSVDETPQDLLGGGSVTIYKSNNKSWDLWYTMDIEAGMYEYQFPVNDFDYWAVKVNLGPNEVGPWNAQVQQSNITSSMAHIAAPDFYTNQNSILGHLWHGTGKGFITH